MTQIATTIEQSKHLLELGLDPKTADMEYCYIDEFNSGLQVKSDINVEVDQKLDVMFGVTHIPAWSLSALLEVMPKKETPYIQYLNEPPFDKEEYCWECGLYDLIGSPGSSPIEAAFQMVCWLLENGYIKKGGAS